jgi:hypothetical protein
MRKPWAREEKEFAQGQCCGRSGPRPRLLGFIGQVQPFTPTSQIQRRVTVKGRERRFIM